MSNPFVGEIRIFAGNFAPKGWATCDGQLLPLSQNTALFSLLGTTFGGDGRSNFGLPDLRGAAPMQPGQGPGLSLHDLGESGGEQTVTLLQSEMPSHPHTLQADPRSADLNNPSPNNSLARSTPALLYKTGTPIPATTQMSGQILTSSGGSLPHNNMQPYLTITFAIALQGIFPSQT